jgi:hypothetical protein
MVYNMVLFFFFFYFLIIPDTESARASRRQLKETIHTALFDMNVHAVCASFIYLFSLKEVKAGPFLELAAKSN